VFLILTPQSAIVIGTMLAGCPIAAGCGIGCSSLRRLPGASYLRCLL
jgi:hypothetical protein